jgi:CDP-diacylglycerol--serine O-phosphatidyltransferase
MEVRPHKIMYVLPNLFTMGCLFCGFYSITQSFHAADMAGLYRAGLAIIYAALFDAFDGRVARATRTDSAFGLELDSLADVVAFGVAPAALVYNWGLAGLGTIGIVVSFLWLACGALRLARFNILSHDHHKAPDHGPSKYFVGLPIPAAAAVIVSLVVLARRVGGADYEPGRWALAAVVTCVALLMVSRFKFRTFKAVSWRSRNTWLLVFAVAIGIAAVWVGLRGAYVFAFIMGFYLLLGLIETFLRRHPV